jgi:DNA polymerase-3 subunit epsilon
MLTSLVGRMRDAFARLRGGPQPDDLPPPLANYLGAPRPDGKTDWRKVPYSVVDVETSGLNARKDALLAIGLIDIDDGRVRLDRRWYSLVRPPEGLLVSVDSIRIHGLLRDDLARAPLPEEVLPEFLERVSGRVLIVHVSSIDVQFLNRALQTHFGIRLRGPVLDTARLGGALLHTERLIGGGGGGYNEEPRDTTLRSLAKQSGIPVYAQHNALSDALTTAQLFLAQATRIQKQGKGTFRKLFRAGGCVR